MHVGMTLQPRTVRPIDYEIVPPGEAASLGLTPAAVRRIGNWPQVAVLRCVDGGGKKLTAIGNASYFRHLLRSGEASDPCGMRLSKKGFPVVLGGWHHALINMSNESAVA